MTVIEYISSMAKPGKTVKYMGYKVTLNKQGVLRIIDPIGMPVYTRIKFVAK